MSLPVSKRLAAVRPSPTGAVLALASRLKAEGRDIADLGAGEPDFVTPQHICEAAHKAIRDGKTKYTPVDGSASLKDAIAGKFERDNDLVFSADEIIVSSGAKQCLFNLALAVLNPADEAVIPAPYWVSYPDMARLAGGRVVTVDAGLEDDFKISPESLDAALSEKSRLFFLNSPNNPSGAAYSRQELIALGEVLARYPSVVIVADDIYEHIHFADEPFVSFATACPDLADRTVTVNGVSKAYAMTGWRIGYAAGPKTLISATRTIQSQSTSNPCSVSQVAAEAALRGSQDCVAKMCAEYRDRHDYLVSSLNAVDGVTCRAGEGTFYALPRVTDAMKKLQLASDVDLSDRLLRKADLACVPGSAFGVPGHLRLSFACSMQVLESAIERLNRVFDA